MRFGAMNFPVRPILDEIDAIAKIGMDYLELAMDPPQAHHDLIRQQKRFIRQSLVDRGLGLACHLPTFVYTADLTDSIRQASLKEVVHSMEVAAELGAEKVVLHPGYIGGLAVFILEQAIALAMEAFDSADRRAAALGLTVCVENMFPKYRSFVEPEDFIPVFDAFPRFKLVFDIGHAHIGDPGGGRIAGFIHRFGDRLEHVHISDNYGRMDDHLPVGHGGIDFPAFIGHMRRMGYQGTFTLEIFSQDREDLIDSKQALVGMFEKIDRLNPGDAALEY